MALRSTLTPLRRLLSSTATSNSAAPAGKLPFEKTLFESEILTKARKAKKTLNNVEVIGNLAVIATVASICAKLGYYVVYGKPGGAAALPYRRESSNPAS